MFVSTTSVLDISRRGESSAPRFNVRPCAASASLDFEAVVQRISSNLRIGLAIEYSDHTGLEARKLHSNVDHLGRVNDENYTYRRSQHE